MTRLNLNPAKAREFLEARFSLAFPETIGNLSGAAGFKGLTFPEIVTACMQRSNHLCAELDYLARQRDTVDNFRDLTLEYPQSLTQFALKCHISDRYYEISNPYLLRMDGEDKAELFKVLALISANPSISGSLSEWLNENRASIKHPEDIINALKTLISGSWLERNISYDDFSGLENALRVMLQEPANQWDFPHPTNNSHRLPERLASLLTEDIITHLANTSDENFKYLMKAPQVTQALAENLRHVQEAIESDKKRCENMIEVFQGLYELHDLIKKTAESRNTIKETKGGFIEKIPELFANWAALMLEDNRQFPGAPESADHSEGIAATIAAMSDFIMHEVLGIASENIHEPFFQR